VLAPDPRHSAGTLGESTACDELRHLGYAILATRYRSRFGEIDIVSIRDGVIGFVRSKPGVVLPATEAPARWMPFTRGSGAHRSHGARLPGCHAQLDAPCRFIVVAIDGLGTARQR
jgi:hypothetical protein